MCFQHCSCKCGNVQIKGQIVPYHTQVDQPKNEKKSSLIHKNLFLIQGQAIKIQNTKQSAKSIKFGNICDCVKCLNCNTSFNFHYKLNKVYMEEVYMPNTGNVEDTKQEISHPDEKLTKIPTIYDINEEHINNDGDFEIMFSNKYYPFIGSYKSCHF